MTFTYTRFFNACRAQGLSRDDLPYKGLFQPYLAYYALTGCFVMTFVGGYTVFLPGKWSIPTFLFSYTMVAVFPLLFLSWKLLNRTSWRRPEDVDLRQDVEEIEEYQRNYVPIPPKYVLLYNPRGPP